MVIVDEAAGGGDRDAVAVGARVRVRDCAGGGIGCLVDDYGPVPADSAVHLDEHTTIHPRRYAVMLDGGFLVFVNPDDLDTTSTVTEATEGASGT